jgi:hypothetical protein
MFLRGNSRTFLAWRDVLARLGGMRRQQLQRG